jgi:hypothetical protein
MISGYCIFQFTTFRLNVLMRCRTIVQKTGFFNFYLLDGLNFSKNVPRLVRMVQSK